MKTSIFAPSILAADFTDISSALSEIENSSAAWVHLDVMDGHFVPNLTFGPKMIADMRKLSKLFFDVHLMISNPEAMLDAYIEAGADAVTFHIEACVHANRLADKIRKAGKKAGISIVPSTPVSTVAEMLDIVDLILVMSVNPGFGGQSFIPSSMKKVSALTEIRKKEGLDFMIAVDGGVNENNAREIISAGADVLVMGSAFFGSKNKKALAAKIAAFPLSD
ncbi:ribulose-phosphate 3-epimerase [Spirochaetota bacterium]